MTKRSIFGFCLVFLLTGCSLIPSTIVNEINMSQGVGYDLMENNKIKETLVIPIFEKDKTSVETKTNIGETSKEVRALINNETRYPIVSGQLRLALYGKSLSKEGINDFVDTLHRDPSIGSLVQMAIVDGESFDLLNVEKFKTENSATYIQEMLQQNMETGLLPETNLHTFLYQFAQAGQDPYLPLIKKKNDNISINGIAIFKDDRFVTSLKIDDLFIFKGLVDKLKHGMQQFILPNGEKVVLDVIHSKVKYRVNIVKGTPEFNIHLKLNTRIQEFSSPEEKRVPIDKKRIQSQVEKILEKKAIKIINHFKSRKVDPLGLGAKYKQHYRGFKTGRWELDYPEVKVTVNTKIDIQQTGIVK